ncbi:hypothetical protein TWF730_008709 [Orbilia blumenaviensis]|uniref:G domain-containing protein n=1 Tax=Orbilia blumenaviensis TaxID=1796055 RepID=A0AAV9V6Z5_9PEZI
MSSSNAEGEIPASSAGPLVLATSVSVAENDGTSNIKPASPIKPHNKTVNVLIVGETQQGKSTLIKRIHSYAGVEDVGIEIGRANISCTRDTRPYEIDVPLRSYHLEDANTKETIKFKHTKKDLTKLLSYNNDEARVVEDSLGPGSSFPTVRFLILDTPGLSDTEEKDTEIMAGILAKINGLGHIDAVAYVRNVGKPYSNSFKSFFQYLQRSMPSLANGVIIIHTSYTTAGICQSLEENRDWAEIRREGFKQSMNLELLHFFMDNEPDEDSPLDIMLSLNATYLLLSHIHVQGKSPHPASSFRLLKTPRMLKIDSIILDKIAAVKGVLNNDISQLTSQVTGREKQAIDRQNRLIKATREHAQLAERREVYEKGPDVVLKSQDVSQNYSWFSSNLWRGKENVDFKPTHPINNVRVNLFASRGCTWASEIDASKNTWSGRLKAGYFTVLGGSVTFYIASPLHYNSEIQALKEEMGRLEDKIRQIEEEPVPPVDNLRTDIQSLQDIQCQADELEFIIKRDNMDMSYYPDLRSIYLKHEDELSRGEITAFISVYKKGLADFYSRNFWEHINTEHTTKSGALRIY